jgi:hypothetical protein
MGLPRILKVTAMAAVVLALEWKLVDPVAIASDPQRFAIPWAMLALSVPLSIGVWAFEVTSQGRSEPKVDALWAVLLGTFVYASFSLISRAL